MIYLNLFWNFLKIGLFSFGGGYTILPLIENNIVETNKWLTIAEYADLLAISQMTPGPIGINAATFVGNKVGGLLGGIVATAGCIMPSFIIVLILAVIYYKYKSLRVMQGVLKALRPTTTALIATAAVSIITLSIWGGKHVSFTTIDYKGLIIFIIALAVIFLTRLKSVYIMLGSGLLGLLMYFIGL